MATLYTDIVTSLNSTEVVRKSEYRGNVQVIPVNYDTDGTPSADTLVFSLTLPQNSYVVGIELQHTAIASGELDIGYTGDPDAIIDGADLTSAGVVSYPASGAAGGGAPVAVGEKQIIGTLTGTLSSDSISGYILIATDE